MDVTRRLRAVERDVELARLNAVPISAAARRFARFTQDAAGIDLRPWAGRVAAIRRSLGFQPTNAGVVAEG